MKPKLIQTEHSFSLLLTDFHPCEAIFSQEGHLGGGYDWQSVIQHVLRTEKPALLEAIGFDSEGSMFCAYGKNESALKEVGQIMEKLISDQELLRQHIKSVPVEHWD